MGQDTTDSQEQVAAILAGLNGDDKSRFDTIWFLATECKLPLEPPIIEALKKIFWAGQADVPDIIAELVAKQETPAAVDDLLAMTRHPDPDYRVHALLSWRDGQPFKQLNVRPLVERIRQIMLDPAEVRGVRLSAILAGGRLGEQAEELLPLCFEILRSADRAWTDLQAATAWAVVKFGPVAKAYVPEIRSLVRSGHATSDYLIETLGAIGRDAESAIPDLLAVVESGSRAPFRAAALDALAKIGASRDLLEHVWATGRSDPDDYVRLQAAAASLKAGVATAESASIIRLCFFEDSAYVDIAMDEIMKLADRTPFLDAEFLARLGELATGLSTTAYRAQRVLKNIGPGRDHPPE